MEMSSEVAESVYFKKFIQLKKYLKKNENRFLDLERANLKAIKQIYSMLNGEQKLRLIRKSCFISLFYTGKTFTKMIFF